MHALIKSNGAVTIVAHATLKMLLVSIGENSWFDRFQDVAAEPVLLLMGGINRAETNSSGCAAF